MQRHGKKMAGAKKEDDRLSRKILGAKQEDVRRSAGN
jgi:hypothetical protein